MNARTRTRIEYDVPDSDEIALQLIYDVEVESYPLETHPDDMRSRGNGVDLTPRLIGGRIWVNPLRGQPKAHGLNLTRQAIEAMCPRHRLDEFADAAAEKARVS